MQRIQIPLVLEQTRMIIRAEIKHFAGGGAHLNTAEGVAARTLLPSGDQAK